MTKIHFENLNWWKSMGWWGDFWFGHTAKNTRITVRGRCAKRSGRSQIVPIHEIQGYSVNLSHHSSNSIHIDPRILFRQQMFMFCRQLINYFNSLGKSVSLMTFENILYFHWILNIFARRVASLILWRSLECDSYPWNFFLIKNEKVQKGCSKRVQKVVQNDGNATR